MRTAMSRLDDHVAAQPWLPRALPYLVYVLLLTGVALAADRQAWLYPPLYALQCVIVAGLLWRWRRLLPELTVRFHWLAIPAGVAVTVLWIALGKAMVHLWPDTFAATEPHLIQTMTPTTRAVSLGLRVLGMSILVPLFEELFMRSLLLRALHNGRRTLAGLVQFGCELPLIGEQLIKTRLADWAEAQGHVFADQFEQTPLGKLSVFGVSASTVIFALGHTMRDWPGAVVCGVIYCGLLAMTARKGLGPVVWAHGITNALLFAYCVWTGDWQFL